MDSPREPSDIAVAKAQYLKSKRAETRLRYSLMADAEILRNVGRWSAEFDALAEEHVPEVLDLASAARGLLRDGS